MIPKGWDSPNNWEEKHESKTQSNHARGTLGGWQRRHTAGIGPCCVARLEHPIPPKAVVSGSLQRTMSSCGRASARPEGKQRASNKEIQRDGMALRQKSPIGVAARDERNGNPLGTRTGCTTPLCDVKKLTPKSETNGPLACESPKKCSSP